MKKAASFRPLSRLAWPVWIMVILLVAFGCQHSAPSANRQSREASSSNTIQGQGAGAGISGQGVDPSRMNLKFHGKVSQAAIQRALRERGGISAGKVRFKTLYGPYWVIGGKVLDGEVKVYTLETPKDEPVPDVVGRDVRAVAAFWVSPGPCRVLIKICAKVRQHWQEVAGPAGPRFLDGRVVGENQTRWRMRQHEIEVGCVEKVMELDLKPGEIKPIKMEAFFDN